MVPSTTIEDCTSLITKMSSLEFEVDSSDGSTSSTIKLPGASFTWNVPVAGSDSDVNCVAFVKMGPQNYLGNVFMANYVTTLDFENTTISLTANANAPDGVTVFDQPDPVDPVVDPTEDGGGLSGGAIAGIVIGAIAVCILIILIILCVVKK